MYFAFAKSWHQTKPPMTLAETTRFARKHSSQRSNRFDVPMQFWKRAQPSGLARPRIMTLSRPFFSIVSFSLVVARSSASSQVMRTQPAVVGSISGRPRLRREARRRRLS